MDYLADKIDTNINVERLENVKYHCVIERITELENYKSLADVIGGVEGEVMFSKADTLINEILSKLINRG